MVVGDLLLLHAGFDLHQVRPVIIKHNFEPFGQWFLSLSFLRCTLDFLNLILKSFHLEQECLDLDVAVIDWVRFHLHMVSCANGKVPRTG